MINSYKKWCVFLLSIITIVTLVAVTVNYVLDPLWCFSRVNYFSKKSIIIDQRLQKTNRITFGDKGYDAVIIGSSRTELVNQNEFGGCRAFNYAIPALTPEEYLPYLNYFKSKSETNLQYVFLGLDFFSTTRYRTISHHHPEYYFNQSNGRYYKLYMLLGLDTLRHLIKDKFSEYQYFNYDRVNNVLMPKTIPGDERRRIFDHRLDMFKRTFYNKNFYVYDVRIKNIYEEIKRTNPRSKIVVFLTPESQPLYEHLIKTGRFNDYAKWLTETVEVFGGVYNFMYLNSITKNTTNYIDADHFYPRVGTLIAHKISGVKDENIPIDFGVYVTKDNLQQHLAFLRVQADNIVRNESKDRLKVER